MDGRRDRRVVVATGNPNKLREIQTILGAAGLDLQLLPMQMFEVVEPVEDGASFQENALIKARACAEATGLMSIADDSGLQVDALDGAPGVRSARFAGEDAEDAANNAKLIAALAEVPTDQRSARFVCSAVAVIPGDGEIVAVGTMEGTIIDEPRGTGGFGYDPHFVADAIGDGRTNAELTPDEKDAISHRGVAFTDLARQLGAVLL